MSKSRLEAFSDGVIAIVITIMVLELRSPAGSDLAAFVGIWPELVMYVLSFAFVGIYWNNHHHLLHATTHIRGGVLWANLHLLFWLSLVPFATRWIGDSGVAALPVAVYGVVLFMSASAFSILVRAILVGQPAHSVLATAIGSDLKGKLSLALYAAAIPLTFVNRWVAIALFAVVASIWLVPDRRIEARLGDAPPPRSAGD